MFSKLQLNNMEENVITEITDSDKDIKDIDDDINDDINDVNQVNENVKLTEFSNRSYHNDEIKDLIKKVETNEKLYQDKHNELKNTIYLNSLLKHKYLRS